MSGLESFAAVKPPNPTLNQIAAQLVSEEPSKNRNILLISAAVLAVAGIAGYILWRRAK